MVGGVLSRTGFPADSSGASLTLQQASGSSSGSATAYQSAPATLVCSSCLSWTAPPSTACAPVAHRFNASAVTAGQASYIAFGNSGSPVPVSGAVINFTDVGSAAPAVGPLFSGLPITGVVPSLAVDSATSVIFGSTSDVFLRLNGPSDPARTAFFGSAAGLTVLLTVQLQSPPLGYGLELLSLGVRNSHFFDFLIFCDATGRVLMFWYENWASASGNSVISLNTTSAFGGPSSTAPGIFKFGVWTTLVLTLDSSGVNLYASGFPAAVITTVLTNTTTAKAGASTSSTSYLTGAAFDTYAATSLPLNLSTVNVFGYDSGWSPGNFTGLFGDLQVYPAALSAAQVQGLFTGQAAPGCSLVGSVPPPPPPSYTSQGANTDCAGTDKTACAGYGQVSGYGTYEACAASCDACVGCTGFGLSNSGCWMKATTGVNSVSGSVCWRSGTGTVAAAPPSPEAKSITGACNQRQLYQFNQGSSPPWQGPDSFDWRSLLSTCSDVLYNIYGCGTEGCTCSPVPSGGCTVSDYVLTGCACPPPVDCAPGYTFVSNSAACAFCGAPPTGLQYSTPASCLLSQAQPQAPPPSPPLPPAPPPVAVTAVSAACPDRLSKLAGASSVTYTLSQSAGATAFTVAAGINAALAAASDVTGLEAAGVWVDRVERAAGLAGSPFMGGSGAISSLATGMRCGIMVGGVLSRTGFPADGSGAAIAAPNASSTATLPAYASAPATLVCSSCLSWSAPATLAYPAGVLHCFDTSLVRTTAVSYNSAQTDAGNPPAFFPNYGVKALSGTVALVGNSGSAAAPPLQGLMSYSGLVPSLTKVCAQRLPSCAA
jgi:hypothetical protein